MALSVKLVDHTKDPEYKIGLFSSICYDSDISEEACLRRAQRVVSYNHLACLRFCSATFLVEGVSRTCSHQFVRSKHLDFLQESQRYVDQSNIEFLIPPAIAREAAARASYERVAAVSRYEYGHLRNMGIRKEDARFVLMEAAPTKFYVTGNFQAWMDFLRNRTDKAAQWEIRECAELIGKELSLIAPNVFSEYNGKEKDS